jgi:hypothetical protein
MQLHSQVVGALHDVLTHARVVADGLEHGERTAAVAAPQAVGESLGVGLAAE